MNYAALDLSYVWYLVKNAPASLKVGWVISFLVIALFKLIRRPVWSPMMGSVEYTWRPVDRSAVAPVMTPPIKEIEDSLTKSDFLPLMDYTSPVYFDNIISRLFVNPALNTYAIIRIGRSQGVRKNHFLEFRTLYEGLRNVYTSDSPATRMPAYERMRSYSHPNVSAEDLLRNHLLHVQSPEVADWKVLPNASAEEYFDHQAAANPPYIEFLESTGVVCRRTKEVAKVVGTPVIASVCEWHPGISAIARCCACGKPVCVSCLRRRNRASYCVECVEAVPQPALTDCLPASFARRLGAFLADGLILTGFWYGLARIVYYLIPPADTNVGWAIQFAWMALGGILIVLSPAVYSILQTGFGGRTLGKRIAGIKVIADNGQPVTYWDAGVRYVGYLLSFLTAGVGFLMPLWDTQKRALHDKFAETRVVNSKPLLIQSQREEVIYGA